MVAVKVGRPLRVVGFALDVTVVVVAVPVPTVTVTAADVVALKLESPEYVAVIALAPVCVMAVVDNYRFPKSVRLDVTVSVMPAQNAAALNIGLCLNSDGYPATDQIIDWTHGYLLQLGARGNKAAAHHAVFFNIVILLSNGSRLRAGEGGGYSTTMILTWTEAAVMVFLPSFVPGKPVTSTFLPSPFLATMIPPQP